MVGEPYRDGWLVAVGLAYPGAAFGVLLGCGGAMGPLAFHPLAAPIPAVALTVAAVAARLSGVRLRWASVALFAAWLVAATVGVWIVMAEASAAV